MNYNQSRVRSFIFVVLTVISGPSVIAQHLFDIAQKELSANQTAMMLTHSRQIQRKALLADVGSARLSVVVDEQKEPGIVLVNENTGRCTVLSGFSVRFPEVEIAPLLIAELKQSLLGDAEEISCLVVDDLLADIPVIGTSKRISAITQGVKLPVFKYGQRGNIKTAGIDDRKLVNVFRKRPTYIPADPTDLALRKKVEALSESHAYYAFTYLMPDGSQCTYDQMLEMGRAENFAQNVTVGGSLVFNLSLTGMTTQQQTASTSYTLNRRV